MAAAPGAPTILGRKRGPTRSALLHQARQHVWEREPVPEEASSSPLSRVKEKTKKPSWLSVWNRRCGGICSTAVKLMSGRGATDCLREAGNQTMARSAVAPPAPQF